MSNKDKAPAFQWYPKDIITSARVAVMTLEEEGAYRRALDFCWLNKFLPADTKKLAMIIGKGCSIEIAEIVKEMFEEKDGKLSHERLDAERLKQEQYREKQIENGKKGGRPPKEQKPNESQNNPSLIFGLSQTKAKKSFPISYLHSPISNNTSTTEDEDLIKYPKAFKNQNHGAFLKRYMGDVGDVEEYLESRNATMKAYSIKTDDDLRKLAESFNSFLSGTGRKHATIEAWQSNFFSWIKKSPNGMQSLGGYDNGKITVQTTDHPTPFEITKELYDSTPNKDYYKIVAR